MKRKTRFKDGGETGRFDEDTYARARKFIEDQERRAGEGMALSEEETPKAPKPAARPAPPPVSDTYRSEGMGRGRPAQPATTPPGQIPADASMRGPASTGEMPGETERNIRNLMNAATPGVARAAPAVGRGLGALASSAREGWREGEKVKEVARAAERGAKSRAEIQAARSAKKKAEAKAMKEAEPILQARKSTKPDRLKRTKFDEDMRGVEYSKGGSAASRRADGCAQRGKTRGKMY
jgi:hypothetical protein